jgi:predicted MFS family arabinose efflux permease
VGVGAALLLAGALLFASSPALDVPSPDREEHGLLGALASPGMRALVVTWVPIGAGITVLEVASPAFAEDHGSRAVAGVMLAALAAGSGIGGLWYGTREAPRDPVSRFVALTGLLAACVALPVLAGSNTTYAVLMFAAGLAFAPTIITSSHVLDRVAPRDTATEAFAWILTAYMAGAAVGAQVAGLLVEGPGVREALLSAPVFVALGALAAVAVRPRLASAAAPAR